MTKKEKGKSYKIQASFLKSLSSTDMTLSWQTATNVQRVLVT